jgi:SNF2 family DNA or RNA helicase
MGLGKTIQSVAFLHQLLELATTQVRGPFLIVAPLSLIGQWQSEASAWCPEEFFYTDQFMPKATALQLKKKHITKFHILITTYEVVLKDIAVLAKIRWKVLIVDEAQ